MGTQGDSMASGQCLSGHWKRIHRRLPEGGEALQRSKGGNRVLGIKFNIIINIVFNG